MDEASEGVVPPWCEEDMRREGRVSGDSMTIDHIPLPVATSGQKARLMERGRTARVEAAVKVASFPTVPPLWVLMEMFLGHI